MARISTSEMIAQLEKFTARNWRAEPADIKALRRFKRPPMGNLPCVLYANFDTFWLGENIQVLRDLARAGDMTVAVLNRTAAALVTRHAARLGKWKMVDTVKLLNQIVRYFESGGATSHQAFVKVAHAIMIALDRINTWIDALIPWAALDRKLKLNPAPR